MYSQTDPKTTPTTAIDQWKSPPMIRTTCRPRSRLIAYGRPCIPAARIIAIDIDDRKLAKATELGAVAVKAAVDSLGVAYLEAAVVQRPATTVAVQGEDAERVAKLIERLEELDDVQSVYANADWPD